MRLLIIGAVVALLLVVTGAAVARSLTPKRTVPQRVALLEAKVKSLEARLSFATRSFDCVGWLPVSQYDSYSYIGEHGETFPTTALDVTGQGEHPSFYLALRIGKHCGR